MTRRAFLQLTLSALAAAPFVALGPESVPTKIWRFANGTQVHFFDGEAGAVVRWAPMFVREDSTYPRRTDAPPLRVSIRKSMKRLVQLDADGNVEWMHEEP
ncbi:MAG: hypothetical protein ACRD3G_11490 [Vicinamibacterales bacterium]